MPYSSEPRLSVVVATYNRGPVLARVLRTLIAQTEKNWQAFVIGDACSDDTQSRIAALGDDRIHFVNLPERFGEQAGPNSVGMALSTTQYTAFLNHDDYWLPDHLERALADLDATGADLYWSRAASFTNRGAWTHRILFDEVSNKGRRLEDTFGELPLLSEPMSSWVAKTDALATLGHMKLATETVLVPIVEYCQRASRMNITLHASDAITVLKDRIWTPPPTYANTGEFAETMVAEIEAGQTENIMAMIEQDLWLTFALEIDEQKPPSVSRLGHSSRAHIASAAGMNLSEMERASRRTSAPLLVKALKQRTGEVVTKQPKISEMIAYAKSVI